MDIFIISHFSPVVNMAVKVSRFAEREPVCGEAVHFNGINQHFNGIDPALVGAVVKIIPAFYANASLAVNDRNTACRKSIRAVCSNSFKCQPVMALFTDEFLLRG